MTLNIANRSSNYYLNEIDRVKADVNAKVTVLNDRCDVLGDDIVDLQNSSNGDIGNTGVQVNDPFPLTPDNNIKPWNDDLIAYYAFDDPLNLGRDCTGNENHGINKGGVYSTDTTRNHCAKFTPIVSPSNVGGYSNQRVIELSGHASSFAVAEFSISLWYYCTSAVDYHTAFSMVDSSVASSQFTIVHNVGSTRIIGQVNGTTILSLSSNTTENAWHHVAVTMDSAGNKIFIDGTLMTTYATGSATTYMNFSGVGASQAFVPDSVTLGARREGFPVGVTTGDVEKCYMFPLSGRISDVTFWNRKLSEDEVEALRLDDYGYSVFILAGQSNMVGLGTTATSIPFDYDYSLFNGRVYQFDTYDHINHTAGTINAGNPYTPIAPYNITAVTVDVTISPVVTTGALQNIQHPMDLGTGYGLGVDDRFGLWKTFCDDLIQYGTIPYRKKILLMPCAIGGTEFTDHWLPGQICYEVTKNACNFVLNSYWSVLNKFNRIQGFLWNQGENSIVTYDINFSANFINMIEGFQNDIVGFSANTPIVVAQVAGSFYDDIVSPSGVSMKKYINDSYQQLADQYPNITLVETLGDTTYQTDYKHLTTEAYRALGYKYFNAYCVSAGMQNRKVIDSDKVMVVNKTFGERNVAFNKPVFFQDTLSQSGWTQLPINQFMTKTLSLIIGNGVDGTPSISITFIKLGNMVFFTTGEATITIGGIAVVPTISVGQLPIEVIPVSAYYFTTPCKRTVSGVQSTLQASMVIDSTGLISIGDETLDLNNVNTKLSAGDTYVLRPFTGFYDTA